MFHGISRHRTYTPIGHVFFQQLLCSGNDDLEPWQRATLMHALRLSHVNSCTTQHEQRQRRYQRQHVTQQTNWKVWKFLTRLCPIEQLAGSSTSGSSHAMLSSSSRSVAPALCMPLVRNAVPTISDGGPLSHSPMKVPRPPIPFPCSQPITCTAPCLSSRP